MGAGAVNMLPLLFEQKFKKNSAPKIQLFNKNSTEFETFTYNSLQVLATDL